MKARTDHLGLSSLDLDTTIDSQHTPNIPSGSNLIPQSLRISRQTITSLAKQPQHAARFRLDALADAFYEPLQELLGKKRYMLSKDKPSSLDCVAVAYLALALVPLPQRWLADIMTSRYPDLCSYVKRLTKEFFGGPAEIEAALIGSRGDDNSIQDSHTEGWQNHRKLPWVLPAQKGLLDAGSALLSGTLSSLPLAGHFRSDRILLANGRSGQRKDASQSLILPTLLALGSFVAAGCGLLLYSDNFKQPAPSRKNLSEMGDAGAMLGIGLFGGYGASQGDERKREGRVPVGLDVDVGVNEATAR